MLLRQMVVALEPLFRPPVSVPTAGPGASAGAAVGNTVAAFGGVVAAAAVGGAVGQVLHTTGPARRTTTTKTPQKNQIPCYTSVSVT